MKRPFDVLFSLVVLLLFSPVLLVISLLVFYHDGVPVLFKQRRQGLNNIPFTIFKFRTMFNDDEVEEPAFNLKSNNKITQLGKVLRKYKLDELPQFFNVLIGDMSVVGPRPEIKKWIKVYPARWELILKVKPGITDPSSILYRNEGDLLRKADNPEELYKKSILPHKLDIYERYIVECNFWYDLKIIFKTIYISIFK